MAGSAEERVRAICSSARAERRRISALEEREFYYAVGDGAGLELGREDSETAVWEVAERRLADYRFYLGSRGGRLVQAPDDSRPSPEYRQVSAAEYYQAR